MGNSTLHIDSVSKTYADKKVLNDIFLNCRTGQIQGIVGRNGSGKSTVLKIVFGVEPADFKFVKVDTKLIKNQSDRRGILNYLPQDNFLPKGFSIKKLIKIFLPKCKQKEVLTHQFFQKHLDKKESELSGGQKRMLEILLIVNSDAKFILLDEPFNGISPIAADYIAAEIEKNKTSKGFIITGHAYRRIIDLADNLFLLKNGHLKTISDANQLQEHGYLI